MSVYYKFKSSLDYDTVTFDGLHISVDELKKSIMQNKKIGKSSDFDLQITHAQTKEVYTDDSVLIPKNTSVIVARMPVTGQVKKSWDRNDNSSNLQLDKGNSSPGQGNERLARTADLVNANASEDDKILAMMTQSSRDYDPSKYVKSSSMTGPLPPNYLCYRCGKPGHWIKNCPTNSLDVKRSTGIPRSFMVTVDGPDHKGAYLTSSGHFAVPVIDHEAYKDVKRDLPPGMKNDSEEEEQEEIPEELLCLICKNLLNDAVLIPCCGNSYCDECIRQLLLDSENHECPTCHETNVSPDNLIPTRSLRTAVKNHVNKSNVKSKKKSVNTTADEPPVSVNNDKNISASVAATSVVTNPIVRDTSSPSTISTTRIVQESAVSSPKPHPEPQTVVCVDFISKTATSTNQVDASVSSPVVSPKRNDKQAAPPVAEEERLSAGDDDRPGTPLADEVPGEAPSVNPVGMQNVATLPAISSIEESEPQPPGISDNPVTDYQGSECSQVQAISTLTTRGPPSTLHHPTPDNQYSRHKRPIQGGHHRASRNHHHPPSGYPPATTPYQQAPSYAPPTNIPPPGFPPGAFSQPPPFPPPPHIPPPPPGPMPPGTGFLPRPPFDPAGYRNRGSHIYSSYRQSPGHVGYGYNDYSSKFRDPYDEFKRKMREKDARARRRYQRRSRTRSRSRSSSSFSSRSYSRSRSRSFSRSPSRSLSRSRSRSPPPRYRRKSPLVVSNHHDVGYDYKRRRLSRSPPPDYHDRPGYKPVRNHEYGPGYYGDSHYNGNMHPNLVNPYPYSSERVAHVDSYYDRPPNQKYDHRDASKGYNYPPYDKGPGYDDKGPGYDDKLRDKSRHYKEQRVKDGDHRSSPLPGDKRVARPREEEHRHGSKERSARVEKTSVRRQRSNSPIKNRSPQIQDKKGRASSEDKKKSDSERHKKHKRKHREKKAEENKPESSKPVDVNSSAVEMASKKEEVKKEDKDNTRAKDATVPSEDGTDKVKEKKHKHKKRKEKIKDSSDPLKKKKRHKVKGDAMSSVTATTDTDADGKDESATKVEKSEIIENATSQADKDNDEVKMVDGGAVLSNDVDAELPMMDEQVELQKDNIKDEAQGDVKTEQESPAVDYLPELSKWERDDLDEMPEVTPESDSKTSQKTKQSLSSEIIQRAEKAILLKPPKPTILSSVPIVVKTNGEKKSDRSKSSQWNNNNTSKSDKLSRVVTDSESLKVTIPNDDKKSTSSSSKSEHDKRASRRRLDRSKFVEKGGGSSSDTSEPHRQSSVVVSKEKNHKSDKENQDNYKEGKSRSSERSSRTRRSRSPHNRERTSKHYDEKSSLEAKSDSRSQSRHNENSSSGHRDHSDRQNSRHNEQRDVAEKSKTRLRSKSPKKESRRGEHKEKDRRADSPEGGSKSRSSEKYSKDAESRTKSSKDHNEHRRQDVKQHNKTRAGDGEHLRNIKKKDLKSSHEEENDNAKVKNDKVTARSSSPGQTDIMIQDDESQFIPDYDGTSDSSEDSEAETKTKIGGDSKSSNAKHKTLQRNAESVVVGEKRPKKKYSSGSSRSSDSSDSEGASSKKRRRNHDDEEKKKSKKAKKEKKHKKHKKHKKSKSKHSSKDKHR